MPLRYGYLRRPSERPREEFRNRSSQKAPKVLSTEFSVPQDLRRESWPQNLTSVDRDNGRPSVGMSQHQVASSLSPYFEASAP